jgi:hypothetical protein
VDDIPLLVEYLIDRYAKKAGKKFRNITKKTFELFQAYDWPGNIRELQNVIERAVILCDGETFSIDESWMKRESPLVSGPVVPFVTTLVEREREMIETALAQCQGRIAGPSGAANKLGIPRQTLDARIASLGIDKHRFKTPGEPARSTVHNLHSNLPLSGDLPPCASQLRSQNPSQRDAIADAESQPSRRELGNFRKYGSVVSRNCELSRRFSGGSFIALTNERDLKDRKNSR